MSYIGNEPRFTQFPSKFFDGDGSAMTVSLDYAPPNKAALLVFISGVRQDTDAYTISGTSLTFTGTVESGTDNVQVVHLGLTVQVPVPADDTITTAKIQDEAVTNAKLANMAANTVKVRDANSSGVPSDVALATTEILIGDGTGFTAASLSSDVTMTNAGAVTIANDAVTTAKILDNNVTLAKLDDGTQGDILYYGASGAPARLGFGTSGDFLKTQGTGANPVWAAAGSPSITDNGSSVTAITINADGTINYPLQCCFRARLTANQNNVTGGGTAYDITGAIWTEDFDLNSDFSNGTFTAPVNGHYYLAATVYSDQGDGCTDMVLTIVTPAGSHNMGRGNWSYGTGGTGYASPSSGVASMSMSGIFYIAAAGTANIKIQGYNQGSDTVDIYAFQTHFSGLLVA